MCKIIPEWNWGAERALGSGKIKCWEVKEKELLAFGGGEYTPSIPFATHPSEYKFEVIFQSL